MIPIRDTIPRSTPPIATWLIILVNWLVFLFELTMPEHTLVQFFYRFGLVPARYSHPAWTLWLGLPVDDYFPFLTSMFIHGGWLHIIANMWALWIFGDNVEDRMGTGATDALKFPEIIALVPFSTATHGFDTVSG
jgi:membrane associated rhomboid family serine protease